MFLYCLKKLIVSPVTYLAGGLLCLAMILGVPSYWEAMPAYLFEEAMDMSFAGFFLPIAAVLPISFFRHSQHKGSAWQLPLLRCTPLRYTLGGLAAAFVSGVLIFLLSAAGFHLYVVLFMKGPVSYEYNLLSGVYFYNRLPVPVIYLIRIGVYAVTAGMYALIAYGVSAVTANQYVCAVSGFAFWITAATFAQIPAQAVPEQYRYILWSFDPGMCTSLGYFTMTKDGGLLHLAGYVLVIALLCGGVFYLRLKKRLKNG